MIWRSICLALTLSLVGSQDPGPMQSSASASVVPQFVAGSQNVPNSSTTSTTCSPGNQPSSGDTIVVFSNYSTGTFTDSAGATFTSLGLIGSNTNISAGYFSNTASGSHTITQTFSSAESYPVLFCASFSGIAETSPVDASAGENDPSSGSTFTSGNVTTTAVNDMLVGFRLGGSDTYSLTPPPSFTVIGLGEWTGIFDAYVSVPVGTYAFNGNQANTTGQATVLIAFKVQ